jgi:hypothetical protein
MLNLCAFKITEMGIQDRIAQAVNESGMSKSAIANPQPAYRGGLFFACRFSLLK